MRTKPKPIAATSLAALALLCLSPPVDAQVSPPGAAAKPSPAEAKPPRAPAPGPGTEEFLPEPFRPDAHASTWANSPFSRRVLPETGPEEVKSGPAEYDGWQIAAVDRFGGKFTVGLTSKKNEFFLLKEGEPHEKTNVMVTKVESTGVISETVVHVTDGSQTGTLTFETKRLSQASKGAPVPKTAPQSAPRTPARQTTPQQQAQAAALRARREQPLVDHLNAAAANPSTPAAPAAAASSGTRTPPTPPSSSRTRRRSVVLPPSTNR